MNKFIIYIIVSVASACCAFLVMHRCDSVDENMRLEHSMINHAADSCTSEAHYMTVDMIEDNESDYIRELDSIRKVMKVKDSNLQWMMSHRTKIVLRDTIYINEGVDDSGSIVFNDNIRIDTCIRKDDWVVECISVDSNYISTDISIRTQPHIIAYTKKVPVGKPRRTWIGRLFQRKTRVVEVNIKEGNPFAVVDTTVFVVPIQTK